MRAHMHFDGLDPYEQDKLALSEVKSALEQRGLDGPEISVVSKKTIEYLEICYPEADALDIHKSVWFVTEVIDLTTGTTDISKLTEFLTGRRVSALGMYCQGVSALDIFALKAYMEIWSELYAVPFSEAHHKLRARSDASDRAKLRHQSSPKAAAKSAVKSCWDDWQRARSSGRDTYKNNADFARDMYDKYGDVLKSTKVIEGWCTKWTKEMKEAQVC
ncbi:hypothetical protein [Burkholderia cepacia]|uniref:hypothetical protein n=1 Tax=Burkholderia cepacia TaxID=292 RepID=UPI000F5E951A|nr:hypothetical protein [Burkholderia cepacia]